MSFILDALKKSESDRQRQTGPALFEVKVAPPKARFPIWTIAIVALLVINMLIVGWLLLRRSSHADETAATNPPPTSQAPGAASPASAGNVSPPPASSPSANTAPPPAAAPPNTGPGTRPGDGTSAPPANWPAGAPPAMSQASAARDNMPPRGQFPPPPGQAGMNRQGTGGTEEPTLAANPRDSNTGGNAPESNSGNPDDYAPATEPGSPLFKGHVKRGTESGLMLYQDVAATPSANLPELRLDLHVYAAKPQERFALINMHKVHEGDLLADGVRVEAITPDGVVMSHGGTKFLLPRD
jgi:general secretion pathway protein B